MLYLCGFAHCAYFATVCTCCFPFQRRKSAKENISQNIAMQHYARVCALPPKLQWTMNCKMGWQLRHCTIEVYRLHAHTHIHLYTHACVLWHFYCFYMATTIFVFMLAPFLVATVESVNIMDQPLSSHPQFALRSSCRLSHFISM